MNISADQSNEDIFYRVLDGRSDADEAVQRVIRHAKHSISMLDVSPQTIRERGLGRPEMIELMRQLLLGNRSRQIRIALHETREIETELPRLVTLLSQFSTQLHIQRTVGAAREIQDVMLLSDDNAYWRKPVASHPRSVVSIGSAPDAVPYLERFEEVWVNTEPAVSDRATGL
jgi:hypothetical protein